MVFEKARPGISYRAAAATAPYEYKITIKGGIAMKEFLVPRLEVLRFSDDEIMLTVSIPGVGDEDGTGSGGGMETPDAPIGG